MPHFVYPIISLCTFGLLLFSGITNSATTSVRVQVSVWTYFFDSPGVKSLGRKSTVSSIFWGTAQLFFKAATPFIFPPAMCECSHFSAFFQHLSILFEYSHTNGVKWFSLWFWFAFINEWYWTSLYVLLAFCIYLLWTNIYSNHLPLFNWVVFLLLSCKLFTCQLSLC